MKKVMKAVAALMLMIMVICAAGCRKSDDSNNGSNNGGGGNGGTLNGHQYVDLGLPSGTLWATCNVGATTPEGYGDYFAWGETTPKDTYDWSNYKYCNGSFHTLTKYFHPPYGYNDSTDNLTTLLPEDDAATANWGDGWRMPTDGNWFELEQKTTDAWTTRNGVKGRLFTASNGNSLFLPVAGCRRGNSLFHGSGYYWSSSLHYYPYEAMDFFFGMDNVYVYDDNSDDRCFGFSVRPVHEN